MPLKIGDDVQPSMIELAELASPLNSHEQRPYVTKKKKVKKMFVKRKMMAAREIALSTSQEGTSL